MRNIDHPFGTALLAVASLFFLFVFWTSGTAPARFAEQLGLAVLDPGGSNEIRAQYAGVFLAAAGFCAASLFGLVPRREALSILAILFGGLIGGRLVSLGLNGGVTGYGPTILALYAIDAGGFALTLAALVLERK